MRDATIRGSAVGLVQHSLEALNDLQRLDESLYERFMEGGGRVADDAAPEVLLRRLSTITFRGLRSLLAFAARFRPKDPGHDEGEAEGDLVDDFDFGENASSNPMPAAEPSFDLADSDIEDALDIFDEPAERDEAKLWQEVVEKVATIEYGLRSQLRELEERLELALATRQVAQALEALDDTRSSTSEGIFALLAAVYGSFLPEVDPATVAPGHLTSLQRALLVRRGLTDLTRIVGPKNDLLQSASSTAEAKGAALVAIRKGLSGFASSDVFKAMRPADRWELGNFDRQLTEQSGALAAQTAEGLAKYLESLGSINRREVLVTHDDRAMNDLREALAAARPLLEYNTQVAAEMVHRALAAAESLYGRNSANDDLILALRDAAPSLTTKGEIEGTLATLELLIAEEPT